jgi:hypothetical protein
MLVSNLKELIGLSTLSQIFESYGLSALAPKIKEFVQQGFTPDTVTLKLQETPEYKQRFAGNDCTQKSRFTCFNSWRISFR